MNISFYDTRNDTTGSRFMTDTYFTQSNDGGVTFRSPNVRVSSVSSNEHDCNGIFPCAAINYGKGTVVILAATNYQPPIGEDMELLLSPPDGSGGVPEVPVELLPPSPPPVF